MRNTVYQHFIDDLKDEPDSLPPGSTLSQRRRLSQFGWSDGHALNLASVHRQIHAEFMTLYLHKVYHGGSRLSFDKVYCFLDLFFGQYPDSGLKEVSYQFEVRMGAAGDYWNRRSSSSSSAGDYLEADWSLDLLEVVSIMRHHPLISIAWNLVDSFKEATFDDSGVVYAVSALKDMDVQLFGKLKSIMLYLNKSIEPNQFGRAEIEAVMPCVLNRGATKQDVNSIKSLLYPTRCRGIEVEISWEGSFRDWSDWESYPEDDWSSDEEDDSHSTKKGADNGEDGPESRDQILCL